MKRYLVHSLLAGLVVGAQFGCLGPRPDETQFFLLTSTAQPVASSAPGGTTNGVSVGLGPVSFPAYLTRPQLVTRLGPNQVDVSNHDRWAESLDASFLRSLGENLASLLDTEDIVTYPWYNGVELDFVVEVDVMRFEADSTGAAELLCRWRLLQGDDAMKLAGHEARFTQQAAAPNTAASVAALSDVLEALSREIAAAVRRAYGS